MPAYDYSGKGQGMEVVDKVKKWCVGNRYNGKAE
jgi:hypothetical protein